ncbi:MAG: nucleotidyltransferase domain-containing protein [Acidimicrobiaceae bacterium]|nr:nucleotidyltransferase domain-containing protein [Acidimicrobiaceae bacterium]
MSSVTAPTRGDAERAAKALARMDAAQVLLFGSVADGTATPSSDIDLVAVFDDLGDYSRRDRLKYAAQTVAREASGRPTDVFVTDRPEWRKRTRMRTSFEAGIHRGAVALVDRPPNQEIDWDKDTPMPTTDADEAHQDLCAVEDALLKAFNELHPSYDERDALLYGQADRWDLSRFRRMIELCEDSHAAVETALKAYTRGVLGQYPERGTHGHHIQHLIQCLPQTDRQRFHSAISPLDPEDISPWRVVGTYTGAKSSAASLSKVTPEFAHHMVEAARRCSLIAAEEVAGVQGITDVSETIVVNATDPRRLGLIQSLRRDPDFAVGTYARRDLTPPPTALPQPAPPPTDTQGQTRLAFPAPTANPAVRSRRPPAGGSRAEGRQGQH